MTTPILTAGVRGTCGLQPSLERIGVDPQVAVLAEPDGLEVAGTDSASIVIGSHAASSAAALVVRSDRRAATGAGDAT